MTDQANDDEISALTYVVEKMRLDPADTVVLSVDTMLDHETASRLRYHLEQILPGHKVIVLDQGMRISAIGHEAGMQRIEEKLDRLIEALAEEEVEPPARTLDGELFPNRERDQTQSL